MCQVGWNFGCYHSISSLFFEKFLKSAKRRKEEDNYRFVRNKRKRKNSKKSDIALKQVYGTENCNEAIFDGTHYKVSFRTRQFAIDSGVETLTKT